ncbi:hypothetical protein HDU76_007282 [Blyttiomyces sp. JEL0837]|nr:hypothetical protein HDU76_007282 [Blyttiomyces sp. JEL0837]
MGDLQTCLDNLAPSKTDEEKLVSLLVLPKLLNPNNQEEVHYAFKRMNFTFLRRMLKSPDTGAFPQVMIQSIAVNILLSFLSFKDLASDSAVLLFTSDLLALVHDSGASLSQDGHEVVINTALHCITLLSESSEGRKELLLHNFTPILLALVPNDHPPNELGKQCLQLVHSVLCHVIQEQSPTFLNSNMTSIGTALAPDLDRTNMFLMTSFLLLRKGWSWFLMSKHGSNSEEKTPVLNDKSFALIVHLTCAEIRTLLDQEIAQLDEATNFSETLVIGCLRIIETSISTLVSDLDDMSQLEALQFPDVILSVRTALSETFTAIVANLADRWAQYEVSANAKFIEADIVCFEFKLLGLWMTDESDADLHHFAEFMPCIVGFLSRRHQFEQLQMTCLELFARPLVTITSDEAMLEAFIANGGLKLVFERLLEEPLKSPTHSLNTTRLSLIDILINTAISKPHSITKLKRESSELIVNLCEYDIKVAISALANDPEYIIYGAHISAAVALTLFRVGVGSLGSEKLLIIFHALTTFLQESGDAVFVASLADAPDFWLLTVQDLGRQLQSALHSLTKENVIDEKVLNAVLKEICSALLQANVNVKYVTRMRDNIKQIVNLDELAAGVNKKKILQKAVYDELCRLVDPGVEAFKPKKGRANVLMFVGLQGAGKTTTCTKLAYYYQRKGWKTCLVCADTFRAGAFDQLKQNATKAKIPYYGSYAETDPVQLATEGVAKFKREGFEIIIVDTSGRHKQESELFMEMQQIGEAVKPDNTIFVMDGSIGQAAEAQAVAFREAIDIGSIVLTKMDGHAKGGGALSAVAATNSPILFLGVGEHLSDLEMFNATQFVSKMLGMGDLTGLLETVKDLNVDGNKELAKKLEAGIFTLRDMYQQFQNMANMGSISKMMGMMPGIPEEMLKLTEKEGGARIKKFLCMLDSMTEQELDSDGKIFTTQPTRIVRVAKGSGTMVREVEEMLAQCRKFAEMIKTMSANKNMFQGKGRPNPQAIGKMQEQMSKMLPPGMLQQMGGMAGIQQQIQQMMGGGAGGPGGMAEMMQNMMGGGGGGGGMAEMMQNMRGGQINLKDAKNQMPDPLKNPNIDSRSDVGRSDSQRSNVSTSTTRDPQSESSQNMQASSAGSQRTSMLSQVKVGTSLRIVTAHVASDAEELELEVGDVVEVDIQPASPQEFWLHGINRSWGPSNGQKGFFPASCAVLETWEPPEVMPPTFISQLAFSLSGGAQTEEPEEEAEEEEEEQDEDVGDEDNQNEMPEKVPPGTKVVCKYAYERTKADEMDLLEGELVVILEAPPGGWWRGMKNLGGKEAKTGWFPNTVVKFTEEDSGKDQFKVIIKKEKPPKMPKEKKVPTSKTKKKSQDTVSKVAIEEQESVKVSSQQQKEIETAQVKSEDSSKTNESGTSEKLEISLKPEEDPKLQIQLDVGLNEPKEQSDSIEITPNIEKQHNEQTTQPNSDEMALSVEGHQEQDDVQQQDVDERIQTPEPIDQPDDSLSPQPQQSDREPQGNGVIPDATLSQVFQSMDQSSLPQGGEKEKTITQSMTSLDSAVGASTASLDSVSSRKSWYKRLVKKPQSINTKEEKEGSGRKIRIRSLSAPATSPVAGFNASLQSMSRLTDTEEEGDDNTVSPSLTPGNTDTMNLSLDPVPEHSTGQLLRGSVTSIKHHASEFETESADKLGQGLSDTVSHKSQPSLSGHLRASSAPAFPSEGTPDTHLSNRSSFADTGTITVPWHERVPRDFLENMGQKEKHRMTAIWELIVTERDYVRDLKIIIEIFMRPMTESKFGTGKNIDALFSNVDEILAELLRHFEEKYRIEPIIDGIGQIFLELQPFSFPQQASKSSAVKSYVSYIFRDLASFLIKPVQRICKYPLILKEIIKSTDEDHKDYAVLKEALDSIQAIITQVNDGARAADGVRKIVDIQSNFVDKMNIVTPTRYLVREDNMTIMIGDAKKTRRIFLFNDLIIIARKDWRDKYHLIEQASLRHCRVCDVAEEGDQGAFFEIEVLPAAGSSSSPHGQQKRFLIVAPSKQVKGSWLEAYRSVALAAIRKKKLSETVTSGYDVEQDPGKSDDEDDEKSPRKKNIESDKVDKESKKVDVIEELQRLRVNAQKYQEERTKFEDTAKQVIELEKAAEETKIAIATISTQLKAEEVKNDELTRQLETKNMELEAALSFGKEKELQVNTLLETVSALSLELERQKKRSADAENKAAELFEVQTAMQAEMAQQKQRNQEVMAEKSRQLQEMTEKYEEELQKEKEERRAEAVRLSLERASATSEVQSIHQELQKLRDENQSKLQQMAEEGEARVKLTVQESEARIQMQARDFEFKLFKSHEEAKAKLQDAELKLKDVQLEFRSEIEQKNAIIKTLEQEKVLEKQRSIGDCEVLKQRLLEIQERLKSQASDFQEQLKGLSDQLKEKETLIRKQDDIIREKVASIAKAEVEHQMQTSELARVNQTVDSLRAEYAKIIANLEKSLSERHSTIARKEDEIRELLQKSSQLSERANNATTEINRLKKEFSDSLQVTDKMLAQLRDELSNTKMELSQTKQKCLGLDQAFKEASKKNEELNKQNEQVRDANRRFGTEHAKMKEALVKKAETLEGTLRSISGKDEEIRSLKASLEKHLKVTASLESSVESYKQTIALRENDIHGLTLQVEQSSARAREFQLLSEKLARELELEIRGKREEIARLKEEATKDSADAKKQLQNQLANLEGQLRTDFGKRLIALEQEKNDIQVRFENERRELAHRKDQEASILKNRMELIEKLEKETTAAKTRMEFDNQALRERLETLETEFREKAQMASNFKKKAKSVEIENNSMMSNLAELSERHAELENRYSQVLQTKQALEDEVAKLKSRVSMTEEELQTAGNKMASYEERVQSASAIESKLAHENNTLIALLNELNRLIVNYKQDLSRQSNLEAFGNGAVQKELVEPSYLLSQPVDHAMLLKRASDLISDHDKLLTELEFEKDKNRELENMSSLLNQERQSAAVILKKFEVRLKRKSREGKEELEKLCEQVKSLKASLQFAESENTYLKNCLETEIEKLEACTTERDQLHDQYMDISKKFKALSEQNLHSEGAATKFKVEKELEFAKLRDNIDILTGNYNKTRKELKELEVEKAFLKQLVDSLTEAKLKTQNQLEGSSNLARKLAEDLSNSKAALQVLETKYHLYSEETEKKLEEYQNRTTFLEQQIESERSKFQSLSNQLSSRAEETEESLKQSFYDMATEAKIALAEKNLEIEDLKSENHRYDQQIIQLQSEIKALQDKLEDRENQNTRLQDNYTQLQTEMRLAKESGFILRQKLEFLYKNIMASNNQIGTVKIHGRRRDNYENHNQNDTPVNDTSEPTLSTSQDLPESQSPRKRSQRHVVFYNGSKHDTIENSVDAQNSSPFILTRMNDISLLVTKAVNHVNHCDEILQLLILPSNGQAFLESTHNSPITDAHPDSPHTRANISSGRIPDLKYLNKSLILIGHGFASVRRLLGQAQTLLDTEQIDYPQQDRTAITRDRQAPYSFKSPARRADESALNIALNIPNKGRAKVLNQPSIVDPVKPPETDSSMLPLIIPAFTLFQEGELEKLFSEKK